MREYTCRAVWHDYAPLTIRAHTPAEAAKIYAIRSCMEPDEVWEVIAGDLIFFVRADVEVTYTTQFKCATGRP